jgi:GH25 family lysozyme M1 (1,4-beta-N-acetylmuramidase)
MLFGVDVSQHNSPVLIPGDAAFGYVRFTSGRTRDTMALAHVRRLRELKAQVGGYHFFIPTTPAVEQCDAFDLVAHECGITVGDCIPYIDVEPYPVRGESGLRKPCPEWSKPLRAVVLELQRRWGRCGIYTNYGDWSLMGSPSWVTEHPIWAAHWGTLAPKTPGAVPWAIHQYRVGPWDPGAPHSHRTATATSAIDHNRAELLLTIGTAHTRPGQADSKNALLVDAYEGSLNSIRKERDEQIARKHGA